MVHCDPAPPHPPPGEVYMAMCLENETLAVLGVTALALVVIGALLNYRQNREQTS